VFFFFNSDNFSAARSIVWFITLHKIHSQQKKTLETDTRSRVSTNGSRIAVCTSRCSEEKTEFGKLESQELWQATLLTLWRILLLLAALGKKVRKRLSAATN